MSNDGRISLLKARIAEREGKPGYKRNVAALKTELQKLAKVNGPTAANKNPVPPKA